MYEYYSLFILVLLGLVMKLKLKNYKLSDTGLMELPFEYTKRNHVQDYDKSSLK